MIKITGILTLISLSIIPAVAQEKVQKEKDTPLEAVILSQMTSILEGLTKEIEDLRNRVKKLEDKSRMISIKPAETM